MSWFFKGKAKGFGRYVSNPFKKSPTPSTNPQIDKLKTSIDDVQSIINKRNTDGKEPKEAFRKRVFNYFKMIYTDYKEVGKDVLKSANERPFKALGYGLFLSSMVVFYKKNPTKLDYDDKRRDYLNELIMCGSVFNKKSEYYLKEINKLENANQLDYKSFIIFSLIMDKKFGDFDSSYEKQCEQLHNPSKYNIFNLSNRLLRFISRIIDIGFCDEWYFLNKRLKDFDVDEDEWK